MSLVTTCQLYKVKDRTDIFTDDLDNTQSPNANQMHRLWPFVDSTGVGVGVVVLGVDSIVVVVE
jgi:hypothetical protein